MKRKDINTFINDKLEQETGIPYKEEYWDSMNDLLNANLPVAKTPFQTLKAAFKGLSMGLKVLYVSAGISITLVTGFLVLNTNDKSDNQKTSSVQTEIQAQSTLTESNPLATKELAEQDALKNDYTDKEPSIDASNKANKKEILSSQNQDAYNESNASVSEANVTNDNANANGLPKHQSKANEASLEKRRESLNKQNLASTKLTQNAAVGNTSKETNSLTGEVTSEDGNDLNAAAESNLFAASNPSSQVPHAGEETSQQASQTTNINELVRTKPNEFLKLNKLTIAIPVGLSPIELKEVALLPRKQRNLPFNQLSISAFVGVIKETKDASLNKGNLNYAYPSSFHAPYGVQAEIGFKRFAIKTGLAWSNYDLQVNSSRALNKYKVDTTYVILDPKYGTTPSGKPYALIKRQIDSTVVSTETENLQEKYSYQFLSVPLALQFQIPYKRFTLILEAGTLHHFMVAKANESTILVSNNENKLSVPTYQMQLSGALGLRYALNQNWAVGCQYTFAKSLQQNALNIPGDAHLGMFMLTRTIW
jgi:hypothetical protein